jgi:hypothetical protein
VNLISIGAIIGGPECARFHQHAKSLMQHCSAHRKISIDASEVNVVFHVPGSIMEFDHVGPRTSRFSKTERTLMIQVGVEKKAVSIESDDEMRQHIAEITDKALVMAKGFFDKKRIDYNLTSDQALVRRWLDGGSSAA